jgi:hypothetical protein
MQAPANDEKFQDKDDELLNSAKWYSESLDKQLVRHKVTLVIEQSLGLNEQVGSS